MKSVNTISSTNVEDDSKENHHDTFTELQISDDTGSSNVDSRHMFRMGKEQQFNRIFRKSTMIMFTSMIQGTWEVVLLANTAGLVNGGLAGLLWGYVWTCVGFIAIVMSLAEMSSMAPTNGGQYHWVSEFAPRKYQKFLSYLSGWMSVLSWQAGTASACFILGTLPQAIIVAYTPSYVPQRWQGTLACFAAAGLHCLINTVFAEQLPRLQKLMIVPHGLGWIVVIVILWVLAPHASAKDVFTSFTSNGGWENMSISLMVGQITSVYMVILSDSAAHLSEEVKNASRSVPSAMLWSFFLNAIVGLIVLVSFLFAIPSVTDVLDPTKNTTGFAFIYVLQQATYRGCIPIFVILLVQCVAGGVDCNCSTSRQIFAFARDGGFPFKNWLTTVKRKTVPQNAVILTSIFSAVISLVNLGSTAAYNALISLQLLALMLTYCISIGSIFYQRLIGQGDKLPPAQWSLGRYGIWVNGAGFFYCAFIFFWSGWPSNSKFDPLTFNWASPMFGAVLVFSVVYYYTYGRKTYKAPVLLVKQFN
ncbi:hypothetical protein Vi05172_g2063 [Venturia inaequalis]|nr:hypothetical protein Vi05172_g2063 [Venturia inaequalis]